jgi:hypothetical protein
LSLAKGEPLVVRQAHHEREHSPLTLSLSKGVSGPLNGTPLIWFDKLTMSGVDPEPE